MTAYASLQQLADVAVNGWSELARRSSSHRSVDGDLLQHLAAGETPAVEADVLAEGQAAITRLEQYLESVSRYADSYLNQRYRELIPLAAEHYSNTGLPNAVATIALGRLYGAGRSDELKALVAQAENYLRDLAKGVASLDYQQPSTPDQPGRMTVKARPSAFDWGGY
ncbi:phage protein Gp36 family protein [Oceanobacter mangrovi]|uniref:phage protein Gp36 family protein n=1 Tax=Oceanobacter mangrovi TaxID=2862510 RepID=UPI001C8E7CCE|nr:phage protein Gp36 family protein [Oceanobacter mangrovi]